MTAPAAGAAITELEDTADTELVAEDVLPTVHPVRQSPATVAIAAHRPSRWFGSWARPEILMQRSYTSAGSCPGKPHGATGMRCATSNTRTITVLSGRQALPARNMDSNEVTMTVQIRPALQSLPAYAPGRTVPGSIKLASNELSFPTLPAVTAAILDAVGTDASGINRYPDNGTRALVTALAEHVDVDPTHVDCRLRIRGAVPAIGAGHLLRRRRGDVRLAIVRGLPDRHPHRRRRSAADPGHFRPRPRPLSHGGGRHAEDQTHLRLHPEQPDRHSGTPGGTAAIPGRGPGEHPGGHRRGLPRIRHRSGNTGRRTGGRRPTECPCPADAFEGIPARRTTRRIRGG